MTGLFRELRRRNVLRAAAAYLVVAWLIIQVVETLTGIFELPAQAGQVIVIVLAIGFVPAIVVSWVFELTPQGLIRDRGKGAAADLPMNRRFDRIIMLTLAAAVVLFGVHTFILDPAADREAIEAAKQEGETAALLGAYGDRSIAVLPFVNMSSDKNQEHFGDGLAEELLHLLQKVPGLLVTSRTSSFSFKDSNLTAQAIAEKLGVVHILEGSVRKSGNRLRITAQLIDTRTDGHLWSGTYDRDLADIFDIQDEVAAQVVEKLKVEMGLDMPTSARHNPEAYALYLRARENLVSDKPELLDDTERLLDRMMELDPSYLDAETLRTHLYLNRARQAEDAGDRNLAIQYWQKRRALIDDLRKRAPNNVRVQTILAWDSILGPGELSAAPGYLESALAAAPRDTDVLLAALTLALSLQQLDLAIRIGEYASKRDPLHFWVHSNLADAYARAGRFDGAIEHYRIAATLSPLSPSAYWKLGAAQTFAGRPADALTSFEREAGDVYQLHGFAIGFYSMGNIQASDDALAGLRAVEDIEQSWPFGFARLHAWRGEADRAFEYLDAMRSPDLALLSGIATNPYFRPIHDDPRWQLLIDEIAGLTADISFDPNLPQEILEGVH